MVKMMQPALHVDLCSDRPFLLTPLAATAQTLSVALPGEASSRGFEDGLAQCVHDPEEGTSLLGQHHCSAHFPSTHAVLSCLLLVRRARFFTRSPRRRIFR